MSQTTTHARRLLAIIATHDPSAISSWLDLGLASQPSLDGDSDLSAWIRACAPRWSPYNVLSSKSSPALDGVDLLLAMLDVSPVSRHVVQDAFATSLATGDSRLMDRLADHPAAPPVSSWLEIAMPSARPGAKQRSAPEVWAGNGGHGFSRALAWWLARSAPLPPRLLDLAQPETLKVLLQSGLRADEATITAWKARLRRTRSPLNLNAHDLTSMMDCLCAAGQGSDSLEMYAIATAGLAVLDANGYSTALWTSWRKQIRDAGLEDDPSLAIYPDGQDKLLSGLGKLPWWALRVVRDLTRPPRKRASNDFDDLFVKRWHQVAGKTFNATPLSKDLAVMLPGALLLAVASKNQQTVSNLHGRLRDVAAWTGMDEPGLLTSAKLFTDHLLAIQASHVPSSLPANLGLAWSCLSSARMNAAPQAPCDNIVLEMLTSPGAWLDKPDVWPFCGMPSDAMWGRFTKQDALLIGFRAILGSSKRSEWRKPVADLIASGIWVNPDIFPATLEPADMNARLLLDANRAMAARQSLASRPRSPTSSHIRHRV